MSHNGNESAYQDEYMRYGQSGDVASQSIVDPNAQRIENNFVAEYAGFFNATEEVKNRATYIFRKVQQCSTLSSVLESDFQTERERYLAVCSLFIATRQNSDKSEHKYGDLQVDGLSITQILENGSSNIRLVEWFELLNSCVATLKYEGTPFNARIKAVQKKLVILDCLFNLYEKFFSECFSTPQESSEQYSDPLFQFGWLLFITVPFVEVDNWLTDFELAHFYFVATMLYFYQHSPMKIAGLGHQELCKILQVNPQELDSAIMQFPDVVLQKLLKEGVFPHAETVQEVFAKVDESLLSLNQVCTMLESRFDTNDFSGRVFFKRNFIGGISKLSSAPVHQIKAYKYINDSAPEFSSPLRSPSKLRATVPITALEATLMSIDLLKQAVKGESATPDASIERYLKFGSIDFSPRVCQRLDAMTNMIDFTSLTSAPLAKQRIDIIKKVYFQVLKHMLGAEEKRLGTTDFSSLLNNDNFNKSLILCSIEAVFFAYNTKHFMELPAMLKMFELQPFDFSKIIESFVLNATWMSGVFKRHFRSIEEQLFDHLAWMKGSVLYEHLDKDVFPSPAGSATPKRQTDSGLQIFSSPARPSTSSSTTPKSSSVTFFLRKVFKLISSRVFELCDIFKDIPEDHRTQIWNIVYYILGNERSLMVNRHIDHMIMCSMYAVCNKVRKMKNLTFKDIIFNYRCICENSRLISPVEIGKILWQVPLDDNSTGDIVKFYNKVFIPAVKNFILQTQQQQQSAPTLVVNDVAPMPDIQSPHRKRVSNKANIFVSPRRAAATPNTSLTPRTKELYSFGDHHALKIVDNGVQQPALLEDDEKNEKRPAKRALFQTGSSTSGDEEENADVVKRKFRKLQHPSSASARRLFPQNDMDVEDDKDEDKTQI